MNDIQLKLLKDLFGIAQDILDLSTQTDAEMVNNKVAEILDSRGVMWR